MQSNKPNIAQVIEQLELYSKNLSETIESRCIEVFNNTAFVLYHRDIEPAESSLLSMELYAAMQTINALKFVSHG